MSALHRPWFRGGGLSGWKMRREKLDRSIEAAKESARNLDESLDTYERYGGPTSATLWGPI